MSVPDITPGKPPPDYKEVRYWKISEKSGRVLIMNLLSVPLAIVFGIGFFVFVVLFGRPQGFTGEILNFGLILIFGIIVVIVLHELAHGIAMQIYGARAKYGFIWKGLMFYATSPGYAFQRDQYIVIILAPLVSLSILACIGILVSAGTPLVWLLAVWATVNGSATIGDLWILTIALRYPSHAYVMDEHDGMRVFMPDNESGSE
ncbi:MAG: DUF3267 domain-containing protein [Anaerolineales bacterium]|jgi:hypothetical protein